jgi:hypothetical protein
MLGGDINPAMTIPSPNNIYRFLVGECGRWGIAKYFV